MYQARETVACNWTCGGSFASSDDLSDSIFHPKTAVPTVSTHFIKSQSQFSMAKTALAKMKSLSLIVNNVLEKIDRDQFQALECLQTKTSRRYPFVDALCSIDPLITEGRAIVFNRKTPPHRSPGSIGCMGNNDRVWSLHQRWSLLH